MPKSKAAKRRAFFDRGAAALREVFPNAPYGYACPLGLGVYSEEALAAPLLTLEHVPPKSMGGKEIALTCRRCNNLSGHSLDANAARREHLIDFFAGSTEQVLKAKLRVEDVEANAKVTSKNGDAIITVSPSVNSPEVMTELACRGSGPPLHLRVGKSYSLRDATLSYLRAAYLVAFAALGYRYTRNPALKPVRQQLIEPDVVLIGRFSLTMPEAAKGERAIIWVTHPEELAALAVQVGRHVVFLPRPLGHDEIYSTLAGHDHSCPCSLKGNKFRGPRGRSTLSTSLDPVSD